MDHATFTSARRAILRTLALSTMSLLIACTPAWQQPVPEDEVDLLSESKTLTRDGVTVTVAVPSAEQALLLFGTDLYKARVQPVWVRVENQPAQDLTLMRNSISRRNHMRLWRAPYDFQGQGVYIGQISRDIGVKFQKQTITTHAIDPYVDHT